MFWCRNVNSILKKIGDWFCEERQGYRIIRLMPQGFIKSKIKANVIAPAKKLEDQK